LNIFSIRPDLVEQPLPNSNLMKKSSF